MILHKIARKTLKRCGTKGCGEWADGYLRLEIIRARWGAVVFVPRCMTHR